MLNKFNINKSLCYFQVFVIELNCTANCCNSVLYSILRLTVETWKYEHEDALTRYL